MADKEMVFVITVSTFVSILLLVVGYWLWIERH